MSTIKSSDEHLTLNADGSSKDIKFQANGVEKASISSAGAFTSTTIDATKLTGTIPNFTSTGIDDNADATAITIDSSENVNIVNGGKYLRFAYNNSNSHSAFQGWKHLQFGNNGPNYIIGGNTATGGSLRFVVNNSVEMSSDNATSHNGTVSLELKSDGRGLSQFTAKAWVNFNGTGTVAIRDSHNISSITDGGTGNFKQNFTNAMSNSNYAIVGSVTGSSNTTNSFSGSTTTYAHMFVWRHDGVAYDKDSISMVVFGD